MLIKQFQVIQLEGKVHNFWISLGRWTKSFRLFSKLCPQGWRNCIWCVPCNKLTKYFSVSKKDDFFPFSVMEKNFGRLSIKLQQKCQNCIYKTLRAFLGRCCFCILRVHGKTFSENVFFWKKINTFFSFSDVEKTLVFRRKNFRRVVKSALHLRVGTISGQCWFSLESKVFFVFFSHFLRKLLGLLATLFWQWYWNSILRVHGKLRSSVFCNTSFSSYHFGTLR